MWKLDHKESLALNNWCFWTGVLEKTRVPWTARRTNKPILKEISPEYPFGRTDAKAEAPVLWPPDVKDWLIWKGPDAGKDWREEEEKGMTEDEMVGWHHWLDRHGFEQTLGVGDGQGSQACWVHGVTELEMTERLNWTESKNIHIQKSNKQCKEKIQQIHYNKYCGKKLMR